MCIDKHIEMNNVKQYVFRLSRAGVTEETVSADAVLKSVVPIETQELSLTDQFYSVLKMKLIQFTEVLKSYR